MVNIFPTRSQKNYLLVSSDQPNKNQARREIAQWAAERQLELPRRPQRLSLVDQDTIVAEWVVIERQDLPTPPYPTAGIRSQGHLTLVSGGRAA